MKTIRKINLAAQAFGFATAICLVSSPAKSEPSVKQFLDSRGDERAILEFYITASEDAYAWANASLETTGRRPLYCQPRQLALTDDQVVDLVKRDIESKSVPETGDQYLSLSVLFALQMTFPCAED